MGLVLTGILTAGIALALRTSLDASERIRERSDAHAEARAALDLISQDLSSAFLSGVNTEETLFVATPADQTPPGEPFLRFTTLAHREGRFLEDSDAGPRSDALLVEYSVEPDSTREDGGENLIRRERWLTEEGEGVTEIVAEGLMGLRLGYGDGSAFEETWEAGGEPSPELQSYEDEGTPPAAPQRELPRAVQVTLMLPPPSGQGSEKSPRMYRTTVLVHATGTAPFETRVVPRPPR